MEGAYVFVPGLHRIVLSMCRLQLAPEGDEERLPNTSPKGAGVYGVYNTK